MKILGKLRALIASVPENNAPRRSWDKAASREIQLEFDFGLRKRLHKVGGPALADSGKIQNVI